MRLGLDVGCGSIKKPSSLDITWYGVDYGDFTKLYPTGEYVEHDLLKGLPFRDDMFDTIWCHHVLEHIPHMRPIEYIEAGEHRDALLFLTDEMFRVLKHGGDAHLIVPWKEHTNAWRHPCHYRYFDENIFNWFSMKNPTPDHKAYELKATWDVKMNKIQDDIHIYAIMEAVKDAKE